MTGKQALLLLPGLLCDARLWAAQSDALADIADITLAHTTQDDTMAGMVTRALRGAPPAFAPAGL